jgi:hypothetical protein
MNDEEDWARKQSMERARERAMLAGHTVLLTVYLQQSTARVSILNGLMRRCEEKKVSNYFDRFAKRYEKSVKKMTEFEWRCV